MSDSVDARLAALSTEKKERRSTPDLDVRYAQGCDIERSLIALSAGFGGQEMGYAVADVLFGAADPGGRMAMTVPARYEHSPAYLNYPGENGVVRYGEGLYIGHRWFDARCGR